MGVLTLINKHFPFVLESQWAVTEGRNSHVVIRHGGETLSLYNIYGPNDDNKSFFQFVRSKLEGDSSCSVVQGGDLNSVHAPSEDHKGPGVSDPRTHFRTRDEVIPPPLNLSGLGDSWRETHPEGRDFTYYSHQSWSRLDYLFLSEGLH